MSKLTHLRSGGCIAAVETMRFLQRGKRQHLPRSGSRQGHLLCRFSQTVYSARKLSIKLPVALVRKRG